MRTNALFTALGLTYIPTIGDPITIRLPSESPNPIHTYVRYSSGSPRQGKITLYCLTGADDKRGNLVVIWKPSRGWFAWLKGKRFDGVRVESV